MPTDSSDIPPGAQLQLLNRDPELHQLLSGAAPAELELQVITGTWADIAETPQQRQEQATAARIAELVAMTPFGSQGSYAEDGSYTPGLPTSLTAQMELQSLAPELAAQLQAAVQPPAPQQGLTAEGAAFVNQQLFATHIGAS